MDVALIDTLIRIAVPGMIGWNIYLFSHIQRNKDELHQFRLHVVENYINKEDLKEMLGSLEGRLEKQLKNFLTTINKE